jgi:arylsulfatase A-like enzyme
MAMAALFTGRTPSLDRGTLEPSLPWNGTTWCGLARFRDGADPAEACIPEALPTLAEMLRDAGYWTIGVASNEFLFEPSGFGRGFDDWNEVGTQQSEPGLFRTRAAMRAHRTRTLEHVQAAAEQALARRPSDRLFLYVHYMDVHDYGFRVAELEGRREGYAQAVARVDAAIGRLLETLATLDLLEGAVVIVTSDHGERIDEGHALPGTDGHMGNPTFQEVIEVPLVVAPPLPADAGRPLSHQDLFRLILAIAGADAPAAPELAPGEVLIGERRFRTYLEAGGRFKSVIRRSDGALHLFDLERDPAERIDVAKSHPDVARRHLERVEELSRTLSATPTGVEGLSEGDRARLRALGYAEE